MDEEPGRDDGVGPGGLARLRGPGNHWRADGPYARRERLLTRLREPPDHQRGHDRQPDEEGEPAEGTARRSDPEGPADRLLPRPVP